MYVWPTWGDMGKIWCCCLVSFLRFLFQALVAFRSVEVPWCLSCFQQKPYVWSGGAVVSYTFAIPFTVLHALWLWHRICTCQLWNVVLMNMFTLFLVLEHQQLIMINCISIAAGQPTCLHLVTDMLLAHYRLCIYMFGLQLFLSRPASMCIGTPLYTLSFPNRWSCICSSDCGLVALSCFRMVVFHFLWSWLAECLWSCSIVVV